MILVSPQKGLVISSGRVLNPAFQVRNAGFKTLPLEALPLNVERILILVKRKLGVRKSRLSIRVKGCPGNKPFSFLQFPHGRRARAS